MDVLPITTVEINSGFWAGGNASDPRVVVDTEGTSAENRIVNYREDVAEATPKPQGLKPEKKATPGCNTRNYLASKSLLSSPMCVLLTN